MTTPQSSSTTSRPLKFGDHVECLGASPDNPRKFGYFVRAWNRDGGINPGMTVEVTDGNGEFWSGPHSNYRAPAIPAGGDADLLKRRSRDAVQSE